MSEDFNYRISSAKPFEKKLFYTVEDLGFTPALNGTEHTHPGFVDNLRNSTDQTSLAIRFQPDGVCAIGSIPRSFYLEAKDSNTIEKTAYEQYMKLFDAGNVVVVVFGKLDWGWNFIENVQLISGEETVSKYPDRLRLPVEDDWISPRCLPKKKYINWKQKYPHASGTPYRHIDKASLFPFKRFREKVIKELSGISITI